MLFSERTVAQMAAFFLHKSGGQMSLLKLMKLLYLAERESLSRDGSPMCGDRLVAMQHGPLLSTTYELASGFAKGEDWSAWIADKENHEVSLKKDVVPESLDEMSPSIISVLESTWNKFGEYDRWQISNYTHKHCPEWIRAWKASGGKICQISHKDLFLALGWPSEDAQNVSEDIAEQAALEREFDS